jgi:hypothetical protein
MEEQWIYILAMISFIAGAFVYLYLSTNGFFDKFKDKKNGRK